VSKWILVTLLLGIATFIASPYIWIPPPGVPVPTPSQVPYFIILSLFESFSFGLGVAFLLFAYPTMRKTSKDSKIASILLYLAIGWLLISWWVHDGFHKVNGENLQGLLLIEYAFHLTLILAGTLAAFSFMRILLQKA